MQTSTEIPVHQLPTSCHVCGRPEADHEPRITRSGSATGLGHPFWSNADADAAAAEHDRRMIAAGGPLYSSGARTAEAHYVATERPA